MQQRLIFLLFVTSALGAWWAADHYVTPWISDVSGYDRISDRNLSILLGHWVFGQLPRVVLCGLVWMVGHRFNLIPSIATCLKPGRLSIVIKYGMTSSIVLVAFMILIAVAEKGVFGFHPDYTKAAGDLVSNLYEEFVYRGLMFCAFYGLASGASFGTNPSLSNWGIIAGTIGSCAVFGFAHEQYNLDLRIFIGIASIAFVYPWVKTRTLWAPWLAHMVVDLIGDTFIEL